MGGHTQLELDVNDRANSNREQMILLRLKLPLSYIDMIAVVADLAAQTFRRDLAK